MDQEDSALLTGYAPRRLSSVVADLLIEEPVVILQGPRAVRKQLSWLPEPTDVGHWRTHDGAEVDLVIERMDGGVIGFEFKSDTRVQGKAFQGLRLLRDKLAASFIGGVVLYPGERGYTYEDRLHAVPIDRLWTYGSGQA